GAEARVDAHEQGARAGGEDDGQRHGSPPDLARRPVRASVVADMHSDFWHQAWRDGHTAFHEGATNRFLARYLPLFGPARHVLVPLCGKTEDMATLARAGHSV